MAHYEKYTKGAMGHMLSHYDRSEPSSKSNIDPLRTHLNYNLADKDQPLNQLDYIHKRLSEVKVLKRKDVKVLCDWIVTAPQELTNDFTRQFFEITYNFAVKRYGKENVVSAYVHMDEVTPHMHFAFIPIVEDKKYSEKHPDLPIHFKVSAKEKVGKWELKNFQYDLEEEIKKTFPILTIMNGATKGGNLTVEQLRYKSSLEYSLSKLKEEYSETEDKFFDLTRKINESTSKLENQVIEIKNNESTLESQNEAISYNSKVISYLNEEISRKNNFEPFYKRILDKLIQYIEKILNIDLSTFFDKNGTVNYQSLETALDNKLNVLQYNQELEDYEY